MSGIFLEKAHNYLIQLAPSVPDATFDFIANEGR
jgi:hypothetical protein